MPVLPPDTVVALTTPPGQGAIAVIEVHGRRSRSVVREVLRSKKHDMLDRPLHMIYGHIHRHGVAVDEVMVRMIPADRSFTGAECVEIQCHGGQAAVEAVMACLRRRSVQQVEWPALVDLARRNGRIDSLQAEAYRLLPGAWTTLAAMVLNDQTQGALSRAVREIRSMEDVRRLRETSRLGCALTAPMKIVITGRPNVGKSTLFNALLERERALVYPEAGTTRDPVTAVMAIEGIPLTLVDTAGIHEPKDRLDAEGMERAREELDSADLALAVREAGRDPDAEERRFLDSLNSQNMLRVINKCDVAGTSEGLAVSALRGTGIQELRKAMIKTLSLALRYPPGAPMVFTRRQHEVLERATDPAAARTGLLAGGG